jgi:hypothetical protein
MLARERGYISMGEVKSLIFFFDVPKGLNDIRMVYDGTKSGLNAALWAPWLPLPTVDSLLRSVVPGTFMSNNDVGEMFLNFVLHSSIQERCGVDLTKFFPEKVDSEDNIQRDMKVRWERPNINVPGRAQIVLSVSSLACHPCVEYTNEVHGVVHGVGLTTSRKADTRRSSVVGLV